MSPKDPSNPGREGPQESESLPGRIGPYRLEGSLGGGGMGEVYRAVDTRLDRPVAVKHLETPPAMEGPERQRFWREARAIARLSHPAIVQVFDVLEDDRGGWLVMELVEGEPLSERLARGPVDPAAALCLVTDVAEALATAHGKGILHRDLKTENVMVTPAGRAKLLDFGLARLEIAEEEGVGAEGQIVGTPHAMSPEQAMSLELDHRSDLFSLGALLYETLTGARPFDGDSMVATLHQVCVVRQRPAAELEPRIPEELSQLADRLLEKDPDDRPGSAAGVARALRNAARRLPEEGPGEDVETPAAGVRATPSGERRQVTVVHCELTRHSGALDPEEILAVRPELWSLAARMASRFDGEIGELSDQGLTILFGYPSAREDDARRALLAAKGVVTGVEFLAANAGVEGLSVRVGMHTGPAVVAGAGHPKLALGETATMAAGLQSLAPPGAVLLSAATREIVASFARTEALAPAQVPGLAAPLIAFLWLGDRDGPEDGRAPLEELA